MMASAVAGTRKPIFSGAPRAKPCLPLWQTNDLGMQRAEIRGDIASVIENQSTTRHRACKLAKGNFVHGNQHARMRNQRRPDAFLGETHVTVSTTGTHLRPIGRPPAYLQAFAQARFSRQLP